MNKRREQKRVPQPAEWLSVQQAADEAGTRIANIYNAIYAGKLVAEIRRTDRGHVPQWRVERKSFEEWRSAASDLGRREMVRAS